MLKAHIKNKYYKPFRKKFAEIKKKQTFKKNLRATDVFIVGHPKSGNTWLSRMIASLKEHQFDNNVNLENINSFIPTFHAKDNNIQMYADYPNPRVFRNEGPIYPEEYPKTIYIVRDPRSVYVSYYHHCVHDTQNHDWPIDEFVTEMLTHGGIHALEPYLIRWDKQFLQWKERSLKQSVKIIKYEDIHLDTRTVLIEMADYIGLDYDEEMISKALDKGTFKNMRKEEITYGAAPYSGDKGEKGFFVRKGKIDGWKDELSSQIVNKICSEFSEAMKSLGYL